MIARGRGLALGLALVAGVPAAEAHDTTPKPIAHVTVAPRAADIAVTATIPIVALTDVNWPRESDGTLTATALAEPLALVARDFAARLELSEGDNLLPLPTARATLGADAASVDVTLDYIAPARRGPLSARLRALPAQPDAVPTVATFVVPEGPARVFEITGATERIVFEPSLGSAIAQFTTRGARALLGAWEALLFALCLGLTRRATVTVRRAAVTWLSGLAAATFFGAVLLTVGNLPVLHAVAASVLVMAALLGLVQRESRWLAPLAALFGIVDGLALGDAFTHARAFAGDHPAIGLAVFVLVVVAGYAWLLALVSALGGLVRSWGVPAALLGGVISVFALHNALHLVDEQATLADNGAVGLRSLIVALVAVWMLIAIAAGWLSSRRASVAVAPGQAPS